ncbi:protein of unknown function DUF29 [Synechococcus sp. PCC 7502]|uniref:DUF29 domain-containing protein n=1 Tax=Synechococcus sp. PCC 7502 TaxID=1173263 RepID=UPI00029FB06F|nr:DUF29 domain-containing protein [Synechococcus sp. PCC 7502]AFY72499.1 protein of unknown function DUF29 [Synechococcus sp. PCC 7502]
MLEKTETSSSNLYEHDFYAWIKQQVNLLNSHEWEKIDLSNLVEEIESLGKQQRQEFRNRLAILIAHLLKWEYQEARRSHSWLATIRIQRREIIRLLQENPSLKPYIPEAVIDAYENARDLASAETNLSAKIFPENFPYSLEQTLDSKFFPKGDDFPEI